MPFVKELKENVEKTSDKQTTTIIKFFKQQQKKEKIKRT